MGPQSWVTDWWLERWEPLPGPEAEPSWLLEASQLQMRSVLPAAPGDTGCARGGGLVCVCVCLCCGRVCQDAWVLLEPRDSDSTSVSVPVGDVHGTLPSSIRQSLD